MCAQVQSSMARALGSLLQTTTQLNILEMCVDPGMVIMKSLSQVRGHAAHAMTVVDSG